jgi:hypothetical protein
VRRLAAALVRADLSAQDLDQLIGRAVKPALQKAPTSRSTPRPLIYPSNLYYPHYQHIRLMNDSRFLLLRLIWK